MRKRKQQNQRKRLKGWFQQNSISGFIFSARRQVNRYPQKSDRITQ